MCGSIRPTIARGPCWRANINDDVQLSAHQALPTPFTGTLPSEICRSSHQNSRATSLCVWINIAEMARLRLPLSFKSFLDNLTSLRSSILCTSLHFFCCIGRQYLVRGAFWYYIL